MAKLPTDKFTFLHPNKSSAARDFSGKRIGIYGGTFNPVHTGHITFALQSIVDAELDQVIFLPERQPRDKIGVEHFGHRTAMLSRAIKPHPNLAVLELADKSFTYGQTWPQLKTLFPGAKLIMLMGSDVALSLPNWPHSAELIRDTELIVGLRNHSSKEIAEIINKWDTRPSFVYLLNCYAPEVSSSSIRTALRQSQTTKGLLASVKQYSKHEWLYVSIDDLESRP
jgi:nicotinate-nucleotide adenylyltransferase